MIAFCVTQRIRNCNIHLCKRKEVLKSPFPRKIFDLDNKCTIFFFHPRIVVELFWPCIVQQFCWNKVYTSYKSRRLGKCLPVLNSNTTLMSDEIFDFEITRFPDLFNVIAALPIYTFSVIVAMDTIYLHLRFDKMCQTQTILYSLCNSVFLRSDENKSN